MVCYILRVIGDKKQKSTNCFIPEFLHGLIGLHSFDAISLASTIVNILKKCNRSIPMKIYKISF